MIGLLDSGSVRLMLINQSCFFAVCEKRLNWAFEEDLKSKEDIALRLGPIVAMKAKTFDNLLLQKTLLMDENSRLSNELGAGNTIHSFMHYPWNAATAAKVIGEPDAREEKHINAVRRICLAYENISKETKAVGDSMWTDIEAKHSKFISAVKQQDIGTAGLMLSQLFQSELIWGLGKYDQNLLSDILSPHDRTHVQLRITDALVSLGQAVGVTKLTSIEQQGIEPHLKVLDANLDELVASLERELSFEICSPKVAGAYGCEVAGKFVTLDGLINTYVAHRVKQLGATNQSIMVEIGGGFGCLAEIIKRAIGSKYFIYDLPWVTLIQAYYVMMSLPQESQHLVRLFGETNSSAQIEILPFWCFYEHQNNSVDFIINSDSLPEMSHDAGSAYVEKISKVLRGKFLSINQEAGAKNSQYGRQNCVYDLAKAVGRLKLTSRQIYWMRQGYLEEVYEPERNS
jgi:hypothetical protein